MRRNQRLRQITKVYKPLKDLFGRNFGWNWDKNLEIFYQGEEYQALCPVCCSRLKQKTQRKSKTGLVLIHQVLPICKKGHKFLYKDILIGDKLEAKP